MDSLNSGDSLVVKLCPTICDPMDCRPVGSSVSGISQARILEWFAISFFRGPSPLRDGTQVFCTTDDLLNSRQILC